LQTREYLIMNYDEAFLARIVRYAYTNDMNQETVFRYGGSATASTNPLGYGCSARQAGAIDGKTWPDDTVRHLFPGKGGG